MRVHPKEDDQMSDEREKKDRLETEQGEEPEVEAHKKEKFATDEGDEPDDVEAHVKIRPKHDKF